MVVYDSVSDPRLYYLRDFQSKRLRDTYSDLAAMPEYEPACHFFFNRLYSTEDSTRRDASFRKVYHLAKRFLGGDVVRSMAELIELQELTVRLDERLLEVLDSENAPREFDMATYERAYRMSDNYRERVKQIELLEFTNRLIFKISHRFGIGMVLKGLRRACLIFGETHLVDFLMDGYRAFSRLREIDTLAEAIVSRESERLDRIYAPEPAEKS